MSAPLRYPPKVSGLLHDLEQAGFEVRPSGKGGTLNVLHEGERKGFLNDSVLSRDCVLGFNFAPWGHPFNYCPPAFAGTLKDEFCDRYGCEATAFVVHNVNRENSRGKKYLYIRDPAVARKVLLEDAGWKRGRVRNQVLQFMLPDKVYTTAEVVKGIGKTPPYPYILKVLQELVEEGRVKEVGEKGANEKGYPGHCWKRVRDTVPTVKGAPPNTGEIGGTSTEARGGGGFGDPIENSVVEEAAIRAVTDAYQKKGWTVRSVEGDKCGFDLECRKNQEEEHVEVKGVRASEQSFLITANEVKQAKKDAKFVLVVVTSALSASPALTPYSGAEFLRRFDLTAVQYRAVLRR